MVRSAPAHAATFFFAQAASGFEQGAKATGSVEGDVTAPKFVMDDASISGRVDTGQRK